jgi:hypothetical protein
MKSEPLVVARGDRDFAPAGQHQDIRIENNRFERCSGLQIAVTSEKKVDIRGNTFSGTHRTDRKRHGRDLGFDSSALIGLFNVDGVTIKGNRLDKKGAFTGDELIQLSETVRNASIERNAGF